MSLALDRNEIWDYGKYSLLSDEKRYEVIDGDLIMVPAPDSFHQNISGDLFLLLGNFIKKNSLGKIFSAPIDVVLNKYDIVQPDIVFIKSENLSIIQKRGIFGVPDFVVEIISPSSKVRDRYYKKELYEKVGILEYWIVEPASKSIEVLVLKDGHYHVFSEGYLLEDSIPGNETVKSLVFENLEIKLVEVFE